MQISSSMYYGGASPPGNKSSTPQIYGVLFRNLSLYLPAVPLSTPSKTSGPSFQFLGLPESLMRDFRFEDIRVHSGASQGWQCQNVSGFSFVGVDPAPTKGSGCLGQ